MLLTMRFEPAYALVRQLVHNGEVGEVCLADAQKSYRLGNRPAWQRTKATFSGIIPFIGIHALDLIRWCTGCEFTEVFGYCGNVGHPDMGDMEDQGHVLVRLDNGGSASARLDYCRPEAASTHGDDRLRIVGNRGVVEVWDNGGRISLVTGDHGPRELTPPSLPERQLANFVRSVRGECDCLVPAKDCFRMTEIVLRARESAHHGGPRTV